jgi:hypothetical protein
MGSLVFYCDQKLHITNPLYDLAVELVHRAFMAKRLALASNESLP